MDQRETIAVEKVSKWGPQQKIKILDIADKYELEKKPWIKIHDFLARYSKWFVVVSILFVIATACFCFVGLCEVSLLAIFAAALGAPWYLANYFESLSYHRIKVINDRRDQEIAEYKSAIEREKLTNELQTSEKKKTFKLQDEAESTKS